jgi:putative transposase
MKFLPGGIYHVYNQGNNRQPIFFERENYIFFLRKMRRHLDDHCEILAWCLMPNHFHWLIQVSEDYPASYRPTANSGPEVFPLNRSVSVLLSSYTKALNITLNRSGSLFRSRTKAKLLNDKSTQNDHYPLICFLYIHQNPLRYFPK